MGTVLCVNSRKTGGANVCRERNSRVKRWSKIALVALAIATLLAVGTGVALAELPAPNWMPGFPMAAGSQGILMWGPVPGAAKYLIFQNDKQVAESVAFQYMVSLPTEGEHVFYVVAVDATGQQGAKGRVWTYKIEKMEKPKGLIAIPQEDKVMLRWESTKGAIIYNLFKATGKDSPFQLIASTQAIMFTDTNVKAGNTYYYKVSAKNVAGLESPTSDPLTANVVAESTAAATGKVAAKKLLPILTKLSVEKSEMPEGVDVLIFPDGNMAMSTAYPGASTIQLLGSEGEKIKTVVSPKGLEKTVTFKGLGLSSGGNIWAVSGTSPHIFLVDRDGTIMKTYEIEPLKGTKTPYYLFDIVEGPGGKLFVSDQANSVIFVIQDGKIVSSFGEKGWKEGQLNSPMFLTQVKDELFISDSGNLRIVVFGYDGKFRRMFGERGGAEAGTFMRLAGIASDEDGKIYAADRVTNNIQVFETDGKFYGAISNEEGTGQAKTAPVGLYVRNKNMAISVPLAGKINVFKILGPKVSEQPKK